MSASHRYCGVWGAPPRLLGGRLLVSGWWGLGRKINYTGELMVYFAIAATAGTGSIVPFLVPIWLRERTRHDRFQARVLVASHAACRASRRRSAIDGLRRFTFLIRVGGLRPGSFE